MGVIRLQLSIHSFIQKIFVSYYMPAAVLPAMNSCVNKPVVSAHWKSWLRRRRQTSKQRNELAFIE